MLSVEERVGALSEAARRDLAFQVVQILAPYGGISREVVEPEVFASLKAKLEACVHSPIGSLTIASRESVLNEDDGPHSP
jgi:hypothetical protein